MMKYIFLFERDEEWGEEARVPRGGGEVFIDCSVYWRIE